MSQFYGKEISDLRNRLNEANIIIEKNKETKILLQENLKKALMRGVVAMNFEAMNILDQQTLGDLQLNNPFGNITNMSLNEESIRKPESIKHEPSYNKPEPSYQNTSSYNIYTQEKKVVTKDNQWINASTVPARMKNNLISRDKEEFEIDNYDVDNYRQPIVVRETEEIIYKPPERNPYDELSKSNKS
jgi:hypothetical protein